MPQPVLTAQAVADQVGGRLLGDGALTVSQIGPLDRADERTLSFLVSTKYLAYFRSSRAGVVLVSPEFEAEPEGPATRIVVQDPYRSLLSLLPRFAPPRPAQSGVHASAVLGPGVTLGADVYIGPHVVLGRDVAVGARSRLDAGVAIGDAVSIGDDCVLGANVVCYEGTRLGNRAVLKRGR